MYTRHRWRTTSHQGLRHLGYNGSLQKHESPDDQARERKPQESYIKKLSTQIEISKLISGPGGPICKFSRTFKEVTPILLL